MNRWLHILVFMLIVTVLLIGCLMSCKTTRMIDKEVIKYDSTAIKENVALKRVLSEEIERFEREKQTWDSTGVIFYESLPCPDSSKTEPTIITFNDNGKVKSIESSRIRSLNQVLHEKSSELLDAYSTIDSISFELDKEKTTVKKEVKTVTKKIKTRIMPTWLFIVCFLVGLVIEFKFRLLKRSLNIFSLFKSKL